MYSKFLFVGLGGSGGKTLRFLKQGIQDWMRAHDVETRIPDAWQFLHIDTPTVPDGQEINDLAPMLEEDEYLGLINAGMSFKALQNQLDGDQFLRDELRSWRVEPSGLGVPLDQGAGQFRAVGQTVAMAYASQILAKLEERVARMAGPNAHADLGELYNKTVEDGQAGTESNTYIVVISSLAGGTGAGLLNLVCDILRAMETPAGDSIFGLLYTPEVFQSLGGGVTGGVYPNSLAAICEMLNGQWWRTPPKQNPVLTTASLPRPQEQSGPTYPFLVGRVAEGGVDHGTPERLFAMMARSLLSWVTDLVVQARFVAYTSGNWTASALARQQGPVLVNAGESHEQGLPCVSALGFSRLSVGGEHLERYAQERLTKDAIDHLARYHTDSQQAVEIAKTLETEDPDMILRGIAEVYRPRFLRETQLTEVGPDDNQIIDDLRPPQHDELQREFKNQVRQNTIDNPEKRDAKEWALNISEAIAEGQKTYEANYKRDLELSINTWIELVQDRIIKAVEQQIGEHGLLVAAELCAQSSRYLTDEVAPDLSEHDAHHYERWAAPDQVSNKINEALEGAKGVLQANDERLEDGLSRGVGEAAYKGDALLCARAAALAKEVANRILDPLTRALREAHKLAEDDSRLAVSWVEWNDEPPPDRVRPPAGDFSLIKSDDYPRHFVDLLSRGVGDVTLLQDKREQIRSGLISGSFLENTATTADATSPSCLRVDKDWYPQRASDQSKSPVNLRVTISTRIDDLKKRAHAWLRIPGSAWDEFLGRSIRDFVGDTDKFAARALTESEAKDNQDRFLTQLNGALRAAAPLINIDDNLLGLVHPNAIRPGWRLQLSSLPLQAHPIEEGLRSTLSQHGINDAEIDRALTNDSSVDHIDITSALDAPISVLAVESLLSPISRQWSRFNAAGQRDAFWSRRRAQPLDSFVPAPQALIRCMIRGWFTGRLLGLVKSMNGAWAIWSSQSGGFRDFPRDWLSKPQAPGDQDALALVLESLALAYVEVSRTGTLQPLLPYIELRQLGRSGPESALYVYDSLAPALSQWVSDGLFMPEAGDSAALKSSAEREGAATSAGRLELLATFCRQTIESYEQLYSELRRGWQAKPALLTSAPHWTGLWERHMSPALNDIAQAAERQISQGPGNGPMI